jgi:hypothetical protein
MSGNIDVCIGAEARTIYEAAGLAIDRFRRRERVP